MSDHDVETVTDDRFPGWRARIVYDLHAHEPWGDALAPALLAWRGQSAECAKEVFVPEGRDGILRAFDHFADHDVFERYLRIVHGTTAVAIVEGRDLTVWIFDTADFRAHIGHTGPVDLTGEAAEWRAYLDGEVYGVIVEQRRTGTVRWDDGGTDPITLWRDLDSLWGLFGIEYATATAGDMLAEHAA